MWASSARCASCWSTGEWHGTERVCRIMSARCSSCSRARVSATGEGEGGALHNQERVCVDARMECGCTCEGARHSTIKCSCEQEWRCAEGTRLQDSNLTGSGPATCARSSRFLACLLLRASQNVCSFRGHAPSGLPHLERSARTPWVLCHAARGVYRWMHD